MWRLRGGQATDADDSHRDGHQYRLIRSRPALCQAWRALAGNITGLTNDAGPEIVGKYLELLKEALPRASRVALLWNPLPPGAENYRKSAESAAAKLGLSVQAVEVRGRQRIRGRVCSDSAAACRCGFGALGPHVFYRSEAGRRIGDEVRAACRVPREGDCGDRGPHVVWAEP